MAEKKDRRKRQRLVVFSEVDAEELRWIDSLPAPGDKGPNRSYHVRQALRAYRIGGPEKIDAKIRELQAEQRRLEEDRHALREPSREEISGRWWSSLSHDTRVTVARIAVALEQWSGGRPFDVLDLPVPPSIAPSTGRGGGRSRRAGR